MWIVLQHTHGRFCRVEARSAMFQNVITSPKCTFQSGAIFTLLFRRHVGALDGSGAAVDRNSKFLYFHVWLILETLFLCCCKRLSRFLGERPERFRDCTKEHQSKEAISSESFRASHETQCNGWRLMMSKGFQGASGFPAIERQTTGGNPPFLDAPAK